MVAPLACVTCSQRQKDRRKGDQAIEKRRPRDRGKELVEEGMPSLLPKAYKHSLANENISVKP